MAALHDPWSFFAGDTWNLLGELHYADGTPFNIGPGATLTWELKDKFGSVILDLSLAAGGITVVDPLDTPPSECLITVTPTQSAAIPPGIYQDQLRATDPSGTVSTQMRGTIRVVASFFVAP